MMERRILHVDIASFAVAVERVVDPGLKGRAAVVAPPGGARSLVWSVSLEARHDGISVGMPLAKARRRCRSLVVLAPNPLLYERATQALGKLYARFSPLVEPGRVGGSYIDLTGTERLFGPAPDTAVRLQKEIRSRFRLEATLGVGANKLVSKVASGLIAPPPGVEHVRSGFEEPFLAPLPVGTLPGVGRKLRDELADYNLQRVGELARVPVAHLVMAVGRVGFVLNRKARGIDPAPVYPPQGKPRLTEKQNFASDSNDFPFLLASVRRLVGRVGKRLRGMGQVAGKLSLRLCYADYRENRGAAPLPEGTDLDPILFESARELLEKLLDRRVRVRWLELTLGSLGDTSTQLSLFPSGAPSKACRLVGALDRIRDRYGEDAVVRGLLPCKRGTRACAAA
jgi:DNA polymerase-4